MLACTWSVETGAGCNGSKTVAKPTNSPHLPSTYLSLVVTVTFITSAPTKGLVGCGRGCGKRGKERVAFRGKDWIQSSCVNVVACHHGAWENRLLSSSHVWKLKSSFSRRGLSPIYTYLPRYYNSMRQLCLYRTLIHYAVHTLGTIGSYVMSWRNMLLRFIQCNIVDSTNWEKNSVHSK